MSGAIRRWPLAVAAFAALLALYVALYGSTLRSMLQIWLESETFSHGSLVFPASAYLIWRARGRFRGLAPSPSAFGLLALALALALWLVARIGSVQVGEQFAFVAGVVALAWAAFGTTVLRQVAFPMAFLIFAVPFGEFAIPALMRFTAWFTVAAIKLTGIPVYQDGFLLSIPSGDFEVAKACSGIRYLIASVSLGTLFAYLTFHSNWRRLLFIVFCFVLPILANGLRAYGIVMLAHLSEMRLAVGVDHLVYGWLFFGIVMFVAFLVGSWFRDEPRPRAQPATTQPATAAMALVAAAGAVVLLLLPPALLGRAASATATVVAPALPNGAAGWQGPAPKSGRYEPAFVNFDQRTAASYRAGERTLDVVVVNYTGADKELVNALNFIADGDDYLLLAERVTTVAVGDESWRIMRSALDGRGERRVVYHWFQIGATRTTSVWQAKIHETLSRLHTTPVVRALVTLSIEVSDSERESAGLDEFVAQHGAALVACVAKPSVGDCARAGGAP